MLSTKLDVDTIFQDTTLSRVVTQQEVCLLWDKTPRQVTWAIHRDQIIARKSITGGSWLINYNSIIGHWGAPVRPITEWMV